jgi:hypothetical protein
MAFTRFHDDPCRVMKRLQESTDAALYAYNVPGPGTAMPFVADPHVRLQLWGANRTNDVVALESNLRGLGRPLSRVLAASTLAPTIPSFPTLATEITATPRADQPAWQLRGTMAPWVEVLPPPATLTDPVPQETRVAARQAWSR